MPRESNKRRTLADAFREWATQQKINFAMLTHDNVPPEVRHEFPTVDQVGRRLTVVEELWWWRAANQENCARIFHLEGVPQWPTIMLSLWKEYFQESSWFYEMRARFHERYGWEFGRPWILCSSEHRRFLGCLMPSEAQSGLWLPSQKDLPHWVTLHGESFNLRVNNSVLVSQFLVAIERLRKVRNIPAPDKGHGIRRKPVSFLPIELMDRRYYLKAKLNHSQRSQVSKAIRAYEAQCRKLRLSP